MMPKLAITSTKRPRWLRNCVHQDALRLFNLFVAGIKYHMFAVVGHAQHPCGYGNQLVSYVQRATDRYHDVLNATVLQVQHHVLDNTDHFACTVFNLPAA
jgi:hypothetical protein